MLPDSRRSTGTREARPEKPHRSDDLLSCCSDAMAEPGEEKCPPRGLLAMAHDFPNRAGIAGRSCAADSRQPAHSEGPPGLLDRERRRQFLQRAAAADRDRHRGHRHVVSLPEVVAGPHRMCSELMPTNLSSPPG